MGAYKDLVIDIMDARRNVAEGRMAPDELVKKLATLSKQGVDTVALMAAAIECEEEDEYNG